MKKYRSLKSLFHQHGEEEAREIATRRRDSGYVTGMFLNGEELFYVPTPETSLLMEKVFLQETRLRELATLIPGVALRSYIYTLIIDEISSTNEIEGVRSTRQEILEALEAKPNDNKRFREMAKLYFSLIEGSHSAPTTVEQIRELYDELLTGEVDEGDFLDGELFRKKPVYIKDGSGRTIHTGAPDETSIFHNLGVILRHTDDEDVPRLFAVIVSHFMFEATHPFYDGNGRFGRFLLSAQLRPLLSAYTVLTLSRKINEEKTKYYKAFSRVEEPHNYADATPFLIAFLQLVCSAQEDLIEDFEAKKLQMTSLRERLDVLGDGEFTGQDELLEMFFAFGQIELFGRESSISWDELAYALGFSKNKTREYIATAERGDYLERVSSRPLKLRLSQAGRELLFPEDHSD